MDGQSYLLLIRDEGGPPELQVMRRWLACLVSELIGASGC